MFVARYILSRLFPVRGIVKQSGHEFLHCGRPRLDGAFVREERLWIEGSTKIPMETESTQRRVTAHFWVAVLVASITFHAGAQTLPDELNYQGKLTELDGTPVDGPTLITFRLYDVDVGGTHLWEEHQVIEVDNGTFSAALGSTTPIDLDFSVQYWLELVVNNDLIEPRVVLLPVPYAHHAIEAEVAESADWAVLADEATEAAHAASADTATDASYATEAGHAATADAASTATEAGHATTADSAGNATQADHATTADAASYADYAVDADHALDADSVNGYTAADLEESAEITSAVSTHESDFHTEDPGQDMLEILAYNLSQVLHEDPQYQGLLYDDFDDSSLVNTGSTTAQVYTDASLVMDGTGSIFDDFSDASVDTSKWSTYTNGNGNPNVGEDGTYLYVSIPGDPWPGSEARVCSKTASNYWYFENVSTQGSGFSAQLVVFASPSASGSYVDLSVGAFGDDVHVYCDPSTKKANVYVGGTAQAEDISLSSLGTVSAYYIGLRIAATSGQPSTRILRFSESRLADVGTYTSTFYSTSQTAEGTVRAVLLTADDAIGTSGDLEYEISVDNGSHYTTVEEGELTSIDAYQGAQVILKATLTLGNETTRIDNYTLFYLTE